MIILGIESSCDETGIAIVRDGTEILSNVISSQVELHARYGGIIPELASEGFNLRFTLTPLCKPTPSSSTVSFIVFCKFSITKWYTKGQKILKDNLCY